ncbi:MAG TPA: phage/plasmid replication protein [Candidatus Saccharimonadales bacterium]|nr:phage/plasmid replication protein [Candidatus Saccharimonadales bacterium]
MIDTVNIAVQYHERPLWYSSIHKRINSGYGKGGVFTAHIRPRYEERTYKREGIYLPKLRYVERPRTQSRSKTYELYIELSLTKLYFGNNFSELTDNMFSAVVNVLSEALLDIYDVSVSPTEIEQATVSRIDYSKNIVFTDRTPVSTIINTLATAEVPKTYDMQNTNHKNGGQTYHIHTNSIDIVLYDKVADLRQAKVSEKRSYEEDNYTQLNLINEFDKHPNVTIPRWEIRLIGRRRIRQELNTIGVNENLQLNHLFSSDISRKVLLLHWQKIIDRIPYSEAKADTASQILVAYKQSNPDMKFSKASALTLMQLLRNEQSERAVRNVIEGLFSRAQYYQLKKKTRNPVKVTKSKDLLHITETLTQMIPVSIDDII